MSAVFGVFRRDGLPLASDTTQKVTQSSNCRARYSDRYRAWVDPDLGVELGHAAMYTTIEEELDPQPIVSAEGDLVLVADARLDNRDQLAADFSLQRGELAVRSDGFLILLAYRRWHDRCAEHLLGDFAFVLWDRRHRTLYCARDPAGLRPLYYHVNSNFFAVASTPRTLMRLAGLRRRLDEEKLANFLLDLDEPQQSFYKGVRRLAPAHWLQANASHLETSRYGHLDPNKRLHLSSDVEYLEAFREVFSQAVNARLRASTPIAIQLSARFVFRCCSRCLHIGSTSAAAPRLHSRTVSRIHG